MSNPTFPPVPPFSGDDSEEVPTREVDGDAALDEDIDDTQVDSAEADRMASGADDVMDE